MISFMNIAAFAPIVLLLASIAEAAGPADAVVQAEKEWGRAVVAGDVSALDKVLADDLTYGHSSGKTENKQTYIERIRSGAQKYVSLQYDDEPVVRIYGDTAVVNATARVQSITDGVPNSMHLRMLHVFLQKNNRWQLVAHQSVKLPN